MRKLILSLLLFLPILAFGQNTVTLPTPTTSYTPQFRYYGTAADTLKSIYMFSGSVYNQIYTATQIARLFRTPNSVFTHRMDSLFALSATLAGNNTFTGTTNIFNGTVQVNGNFNMTGNADITGQLNATTLFSGSSTTNNLHVGTGIGGAWIDFISTGAFPYPYNWRIGDNVGETNDPFYIKYRSNEIVKVDTFGTVLIDDLRDNSGKYYLKTGSVPDSTTISTTYLPRVNNGIRIKGGSTSSATLGQNHLVLRNDTAGKAARVHFEPNGFFNGVQSKLDMMMTPFDDYQDGYTVANLFTKKGDFSGSFGTNGIFFLGAKSSLKETPIYPSINIGFNDDNANAVPMKLFYIDHTQTQFYTPMTGMWRTSKSYTTAQYITAGVNVYIAASTGTSGATEPTHTTGTVSDGGVDWTFVTTYSTSSTNVKPVVLFGNRADMPKFGNPSARVQFSQPTIAWNGIKHNFLNASDGLQYSLGTETNDFYLRNITSGNFVRIPTAGGIVLSSVQTAAGVAGTDSVVVKNAGALRAISPTYYAPTANPTFTTGVTLNTSSTGTVQNVTVNSNAGVASDARVTASNGTSLLSMIMRGTGFTSNANNGFFNLTGTGSLGWLLNGTERLRMLTSGNLGLGITTATAYLHIKAGTATASTAPLKFTSGTNLTTPEAGAVEFDGTRWYGTPTTTRQTFAYLTDTPTLSNYTASGTGAATTITIPHGLTGVSGTSKVIVQPLNAASAGVTYVTVDATNVSIVYTIAPALGTSNLNYTISIKP